jgi:hypothetical protein
VTEVEQLIQEVNDESATIAGTIALLDKCCADLGRLMEARALKPCLHAKNLVFGLAHARDALRQVHQQMQTILYPKTDNQNGK